MGFVPGFTWRDGYEFAADTDLSQRSVEKWVNLIDGAKVLALGTGNGFFAGVADHIWIMLQNVVICESEQEKSRP
jgi:hypothetical protein